MAVYKRDMVDINLETGNIHRSFLKHSIGYKDAAADHFGIRVFRNGEPVNLTGVSVQGIFMPPQGDPIAITSGNIISENEAEVVLPQACYNYDGQFTLSIKLVDATNAVTGTMRIVDGMVDNTHASGTVAPTSAVPTYQEVLSAYEQAIAVIGNSVRFDQSQSLTDTQKGTARTNIAAASESELSDVKSALSDIETLDNEINPAWVIGGLNNLGGENTNTNRIRTGYIETKNDTFLHIAIGTGYYANVFRFDDSQSLLGYSDWFAAESDITLTNLGYIRIAVKRSDDADMSATEGSNIALTYSNELLDTLDDIEEKNEKANYNIGQIMSDHYIPNYDIGTQIAITLQNKKYWDITGTTAELKSNNSFDASTAIQVIPGEDYQLTATSGGSLKLASWAIVDASYNVLANGEKKASFYTKTESFHIPQNGKYLLITVTRGDTPVLIKAGYSPINNLLYGKKIAIIGDSISTNGNTGTDSNVPEIKVESADVGVELSAYLTYYDVQAGLSLGGHTFTSDQIGTEVTFTPVEGDIGKVIGLPNNYNENTVTTWWEVMQQQLHCSFIPNTWSGASITSHEGNSSQYKTSYGWHEATIRKCGIRTPGTMTRTEPDLIIIYRGTNDFSHSPYTLLTDNYFDNYNWEYPANDSVTGGYGYKEGLCLTIKKLRDAYPNAKIFLCTLNVFKRVNYSHFPTNNGINSLPQYNDAIREVADFMGCGVIDFDKDGITFENCYSQGYITDSSTTPTHPSDKGHKAMGLKAIADMKAQYSNMT